MKKVLVAILIIALLPIVSWASLAETISFSDDVTAINDAAKSVLLLEIYDEYGDPIATGSGFVAFENDILVTNYHVMEDSETIVARSDEGYSYTVETVYAADEEADLAILGFSEPTDRTPLPLGDGESLQRAEQVVAIGSPKGLLNTVSMGNISALFEEYGVDYVVIGNSERYNYALDAAWFAENCDLIYDEGGVLIYAAPENDGNSPE